MFACYNENLIRKVNIVDLFKNYWCTQQQKQVNFNGIILQHFNQVFLFAV